jgi:NADPH:quinone reductase-like Zn-dependent oxidoreductase
MAERDAGDPGAPPVHAAGINYPDVKIIKQPKGIASLSKWLHISPGCYKIGIVLANAR